MDSRVILRGVLDGYSSYGFHLLHVIRGLGKLGHNVNTVNIPFKGQGHPLPSWATETVVHKLQPEPWEMVIHCPSFGPAERKDIVYNTMWEATRMPRQSMLNLNNSLAVVVPTDWQAQMFSAQGLDRPIYKVPLGIDAQVYSYKPKKDKDVFVFGAAGRTFAGGCRKCIPEVVDAFLFAFDGVKDVRLEIKCYPEDSDIDVKDDRITLHRDFWTRDKLAKWYEHIDCFVSASRGEGWGLMQHEAMAVGRPVVSVAFGGITEFFDETVGWTVDHKLTRAVGHYEGSGLWAEPDFESLMTQMLRVYSGGSEVEEKAFRAASRASRLNWDSSNKQLEGVLEDLGLI